MRMGREVLSTGTMQVRRPDAEELLSLLQGSWAYEQLVEWAEREDQALLEISKTAPLPRQPDWVTLDDLCQILTRGHG